MWSLYVLLVFAVVPLAKIVDDELSSRKREYEKRNRPEPDPPTTPADGVEFCRAIVQPGDNSPLQDKRCPDATSVPGEEGSRSPPTANDEKRDEENEHGGVKRKELDPVSNANVIDFCRGITQTSEDPPVWDEWRWDPSYVPGAERCIPPLTSDDERRNKENESGEKKRKTADENRDEEYQHGRKTKSKSQIADEMRAAVMRAERYAHGRMKLNIIPDEKKNKEYDRGEWGEWKSGYEERAKRYKHRGEQMWKWQTPDGKRPEGYERNTDQRFLYEVPDEKRNEGFIYVGKKNLKSQTANEKRPKGYERTTIQRHLYEVPDEERNEGFIDVRKMKSQTANEKKAKEYKRGGEKKREWKTYEGYERNTDQRFLYEVPDEKRNEGFIYVGKKNWKSQTANEKRPKGYERTTIQRHLYEVPDEERNEGFIDVRKIKSQTANEKKAKENKRGGEKKREWKTYAEYLNS